MATSRWMRSAGQALIAVVAVVALTFVAPLTLGVRLLVDTLLVMSGNDSDGARMVDQLDGYLNPAAPNYGYPGYTYQLVPWNANIFAPGSTVDAQQRDGVDTILAAIDATYAADPAGRVAVVGYSSSADVVAKAIRELAARGSAAPDPDLLSVLLMGNPNRPNGGIFTRFPGLYIPIIGATFDGAGNPDTDYALTDISWKYDTVSDFPKYPLNLLALANAVLGFANHGDYAPADLADAVVDPNMTGTAPDGSTYITIAPRRLPLLAPLYQLGLPARLLDAVTPVLTVLIELGYDRSTPVWEKSSIGLLPSASQLLAAVPALVKAVRDGMEILAGKAPVSSTPVTTVADVLAAKADTPPAADVESAPVSARATMARISDVDPDEAAPNVAPAAVAPVEDTTPAIDAKPAAEVKPTTDAEPITDAEPADAEPAADESAAAEPAADESAADEPAAAEPAAAEPAAAEPAADEPAAETAADADAAADRTSGASDGTRPAHRWKSHSAGSHPSGQAGTSPSATRPSPGERSRTSTADTTGADANAAANDATS